MAIRSVRRRRDERERLHPHRRGARPRHGRRRSSPGQLVTRNMLASTTEGQALLDPRPGRGVRPVRAGHAGGEVSVPDDARSPGPLAGQRSTSSSPWRSTRRSARPAGRPSKTQAAVHPRAVDQGHAPALDDPGPQRRRSTSCAPTSPRPRRSPSSPPPAASSPWSCGRTWTTARRRRMARRSTRLIDEFGFPVPRPPVLEEQREADSPSTTAPRRRSPGRRR